MIYKIISTTQWNDFQRAGVFTGSAVDIADGYIHFSTAEQTAETLAKHFVGQTDLVLLEIDESKLGPELKFEPSRGGQLFPHLYGDLEVNRVCMNWPISLDDSGQHVLPNELKSS